MGGWQLEKDSPHLHQEILQMFEELKLDGVLRQHQARSPEELLDVQRLRNEQWQQLNEKAKLEEATWHAEQFTYREKELAKNKNDKALAKAKSASEIADLREKRRLEALKKDQKKVKSDKARHKFYKVVMAGVKFGRWLSGASAEEANTTEAPSYTVPGLKEKYETMLRLRQEAQEQNKLQEFNRNYGAYFEDLEQQYQTTREQTRRSAEQEVDRSAAELNLELTQEQRSARVETTLDSLMKGATYTMTFGSNQASNVQGGTKPNAVRYAKDGSRWLVKTNHSCVGMAAPNASIMTVAGYKVQQLVHPPTAIEAFETKSQGQGTVSMQRMADNVLDPSAGEVVDLFKFSRTPQAMTKTELKQVEDLSPQLLREHTTDWLLANFDTKGENFIVSRNSDNTLTLRGIDKEAGGRAILDQGAQHMSKDYQRFDQDTVYNQLFRKFADGSMNLDLHVVEAQLLRVEQCSDEEYMDIFQPYIRQQLKDRPKDAEQIRRNFLRRKQTLRAEYRRFFGELVRERIKHVDPEQAAQLKQKYLGGTDDGIFLFRSDSAESIQAERRQVASLQELDQEALQAKIKKADQEDKKKYERRHAFYDFSKNIVMGLKELGKHMGFNAVEQEQRSVRILLKDLQFDYQDLSDADMDTVQSVSRQITQFRYAALTQYQTSLIADYTRQFREEQGNAFTEDELKQFLENKSEEIAQLLREKDQELLENSPVDLTLISDHKIFLGGTKPMSEYVGADGSKWLAKQAVNCMGYFKASGAILTQVGAALQKKVDANTAVDAFVGQTQKHGLVSFQRKLRNVESGPNKLDLFKFSKHPELATQQTIQDVQAIMPQILREHVTDWLLCNFDTKGENFVITLDSDGNRVLHGIDKEAAFNKIQKPEAQHMSTTYRPHANNTLYNVVFEKFANADMDFDLQAVAPYVHQIMQMGDNEYLSIFQNYLDHLSESKKPEDVDDIRQKILARKQHLAEEYTEFFTKLIERRCKNVHPDEAAQLREQYLDPQGRFHLNPPAL